MKEDPLKNLRIASPCPMNWTQMTGDERVRFCSSCNLHVYNIAELTRKQATKLITETEGRICGRIYRRSDGTVITKDCPIGLRAIRRRVARVTGAVFATVVALSSAVFGQKPAAKDESCKQQVSISRKNSEADETLLLGTILDPQGAVVRGAEVKITDRKSRTSVKFTSDDAGNFRVSKLEIGVYDMVVELPGFKRLEVTQLNVASKEDVTLTLVLSFDAPSVTVGIFAEYPTINTSKPSGTIIITSEMMQRLVRP